MEGQGKGVHLINWEIACFPVAYGGLGIPNLNLRNTSLLLRWWWKLHYEKECLWSEIARKLRGLNTCNVGPSVWMCNGSFFWNQLVKINPLFQWSILWSVGDGRSISYWYDSWSELPIRKLKNSGPRPRQQTISLRDLIAKWPVVIPVPVQQLPEFNDQQDALIWRWGTSGIYSAASFYKVQAAAGKVRWRYSDLWRSFAPLKVKFFIFLLLHNRVLTHDNMLKRGMQVEAPCALCLECTLETSFHVLFSCQYAAEVWDCFRVIISEADTILGTWDRSWFRYKRYSQEGKRVWATRFMGVLWGIWKQRNMKIFRDKRMPPQILAANIKEETELWLKCGMRNKEDGGEESSAATV